MDDAGARQTEPVTILDLPVEENRSSTLASSSESATPGDGTSDDAWGDDDGDEEWEGLDSDPKSPWEKLHNEVAYARIYLASASNRVRELDSTDSRLCDAVESNLAMIPRLVSEISDGIGPWKSRR